MPFSDLYSLLKRRQGLEVGGPAGAQGILSGGGGGDLPAGYPGAIDPGVDPSMAGGFPGINPAAARQQALLALGASLLKSGRTTTGPRINGAEALGEGLQAYQGAYQGGINDQLQQEFLRARIAETRQGRQGQDPALVAEYKFAQSSGYKGSFTEYMALKRQEAGDGFGNVNPGQFTPESLAKYAKTKNYADLVPYVAPATPQLGLVNGVLTSVQPTRGGGPVQTTPLSTPEAEDEAARRRREAESEGSALGKAEAERAATFQQDLNVIDDEILRTQRLLTEFQGGKYQTGPLLGGVAGRFTTAGQDLKREAGKDVLKGISSATFGALSEGEREFLKTLGVNPLASEESNVNLLTQRLQELQRTKQRLQTRGPIEVPRRSTSPGAPNPGGRPPLSSFRNP